MSLLGEFFTFFESYVIKQLKSYRDKIDESSIQMNEKIKRLRDIITTMKIKYGV